MANVKSSPDPVELADKLDYLAKLDADDLGSVPKSLLKQAAAALRANQPCVSRPLLEEFYPLKVKPLDDPNHDPGEHQVMDSDSAYIFRISGTFERAQAIVATLNAATTPPRPDREAIIEECAKVLDNAAQDWNRIRDPGMANNARSYARQIRALAAQPEREGMYSRDEVRNDPTISPAVKDAMEHFWKKSDEYERRDQQKESGK